MKLFSTSILAAAVVATALATGCTESPHRFTEMQQGIQLNGPQTIEAGTSTRLMAQTQNVVGTKGVAWNASPTGAKITVDPKSAGQTAIFSADQPGTYLITASVDLGDGRVISDKTTVTVKEKPMASERMPEQH